MRKLPREFYNRPTLEVAKDLLGKLLVRFINGQTLVCRINEVEAYIGKIDKASHAFGGKLTPRTEVMFGPPGKAYVYLIYGMYYCLNVVTEPEGEPCAVLIRGATPIENIEMMSQIRYGKDYNCLTKYQIKNFMNGPGKLCKALDITKEQNTGDLLGEDLYICENPQPFVAPIKISKRINIDYAEEAKDFLWRFYIED
jgi:DNA-3-methyladenine glycosylase